MNDNVIDGRAVATGVKERVAREVAAWLDGGGGAGGGRFGRGRGSTDPPVRQQRPEPKPGKTYSVGEDVVHPTMGEGVVIGVEPAGLIVVRFASDGSERKLMADYAPLEKR